MNSTVIPKEKVTKLKELAKEIEALTWEYMTFREDKMLYSLYEKQNEILTLINQL